MRPLVVAVLLTAALHAAAADSITCTGNWAPATLSEQSLIRAFGKANVVRGMVYVAEGTEEQGTIVFPNDERRRVEVVWKKGRKADWIRIPMGSQWTTFAGIRVGTPLRDVQRLNVEAFTLNGFDWDFGGMVTDWRGGRLADVAEPCTLQLRFDRSVPDAMTPQQEKAFDATSGEQELMSSMPALRQFPVRVSEIVIQYP